MYFQLAWRNIWRNSRRTLTILTAIFVGVTSMIFLSSLTRGVMEGMVENAIDNLTGHIRIQNPEYRRDPAIENRIQNPESLIRAMASILPDGAKQVQRIRVDGVLNTARETSGVVMVGIEPEKEKGCSFIGDATLEGRFFDDDDKNGVVLGKAMMEKLGTRIGRKIVLMSQDTEGEIASKAFRIRGVYHSEMASTEKIFVFVPLRAMQRMLKAGEGVTEITLTLPDKDISQTDLSPLTTAINQELGQTSFRAEHWREMLPAISAYLEMFQGFLFIWYLVIFVAMGFGLVNTVLMAVYERMREFGLLKALGMRPIRIFRMVLRETLFLLALGISAGNVVAFICIWLLSDTGIDLSAFSQGTDMWGISRVILPVLNGGDVLIANVTVLLLGLIVGVYPAIRAASFTPVETMRQL
ncbi:MAG: MacB protein [Desulfobacteraceae bacterium 4572_88]|nr:MAG: MacB protein [Desulfobacteraceae bacterium 4572_88]